MKQLFLVYAIYWIMVHRPNEKVLICGVSTEVLKLLAEDLCDVFGPEFEEKMVVLDGNSTMKDRALFVERMGDGPKGDAQFGVFGHKTAACGLNLPACTFTFIYEDQ